MLKQVTLSFHGLSSSHDIPWYKITNLGPRQIDLTCRSSSSIRPQKRKGAPLPLPPPPNWKSQINQPQMIPETALKMSGRPSHQADVMALLGWSWTSHFFRPETTKTTGTFDTMSFSPYLGTSQDTLSSSARDGIPTGISVFPWKSLYCHSCFTFLSAPALSCGTGYNNYSLVW